MDLNIKAGKGCVLLDYFGSIAQKVCWFELKGFAGSTGIAADHRCRKKSVESLQTNVQWLKEYRRKLILFPVYGNKKPRKGDNTEEERKALVFIDYFTDPVILDIALSLEKSRLFSQLLHSSTLSRKAWMKWIQVDQHDVLLVALAHT
ncbi:Hypothetical predicted protein [Cloeon dipterum]|uniref:Large ribosomal subunit protein eL13 n=1 Tax=Cloeon dipterum TaxID=197152 RepID=A0A8S1E8N0_9INSE|nr:Hypothetical predicted protein [Cloeon dipterum]